MLLITTPTCFPFVLFVLTLVLFVVNKALLFNHKGHKVHTKDTKDTLKNLRSYSFQGER